ncbi:MAG: hypothetical protein ACM3TR_09795 [Caulobacteraceae bacterium]
MKKFMLGFLFGALLFASVGVFAAEYVINPNPFPIVIDGVQQQVEAYNINGFTFLKLADVGKVFNRTVKFNESVPQIEISQTGSDIVMEPAPTTENSISIPKEPVYKKTTYNGDFAIEYNSKIYLPLYDVQKKYLITVKDNPNKTLTLSKGEKSITINMSDDNSVIIIGNTSYYNKDIVESF